MKSVSDTCHVRLLCDTYAATMRHSAAVMPGQCISNARPVRAQCPIVLAQGHYSVYSVRNRQEAVNMTEQQDNRRSQRVVVYVTADWERRLEEAFARDELEKADWLRRTIEHAIGRSEIKTPDEANDGRRVAPEVLLAAAQERIRGLEEINRGLEALIQQQGERQGMSDSLNQELTKRLGEVHSTVDRMTLMLPAAGQTGQRWWKFW